MNRLGDDFGCLLHFVAVDDERRCKPDDIPMRVLSQQSILLQLQADLPRVDL